DVADCPPGCADLDADGYPDLACGGSDCNDNDAAVHPLASELDCNGADDDCDARTPDAPDHDLDGFVAASCSGTDCDDANPLINPSAGEQCRDGLDNNCDGATDLADGLCGGAC